MELSTTSQIKWCNPSRPVEPIYIPGRFRTGSNPSKTYISFASYEGSFGSFLSFFSAIFSISIIHQNRHIYNKLKSSRLYLRRESLLHTMPIGIWKESSSKSLNDTNK